MVTLLMFRTLFICIVHKLLCKTRMAIYCLWLSFLACLQLLVPCCSMQRLEVWILEHILSCHPALIQQFLQHIRSSLHGMQCSVGKVFLIEVG